MITLAAVFVKSDCGNVAAINRHGPPVLAGDTGKPEDYPENPARQDLDSDYGSDSCSR